MPTNLLRDSGRRRLRSSPRSPALRARPGTALSVLSVTREEHEGLLVLALGGELDAYTVAVFAEHVNRLEPHEIQLVVDLSFVQLVDSAGLSALLSLRNRAQRDGAELGLICPPGLARLFRLTGLRPAFAFGDNLAAVRTALTGTCDGAGAALAPTP